MEMFKPFSPHTARLQSPHNQIPVVSLHFFCAQVLIQRIADDIHSVLQIKASDYSK